MAKKETKYGCMTHSGRLNGRTLKLRSRFDDVVGNPKVKAMIYFDLNCSKSIKSLVLKALNEFEDALSGLGQFFATKSALRKIKNPFYFTLKALFAL